MSPLLQTFANGSALGYRSLSAAAGTSFESIATVTVGSGGASSVEFTSIPATYSHLQVRLISRQTTNQTNDYLYTQLNNDTSALYRTHQISGDGSSVAAADFGAINQMYIQRQPAASSTASVFSGIIFDVLDYANTNKFKTLRQIGGFDANGSGFVYFVSGLWRSTNAITSIKIFPGQDNFAQYSHFALYGIRSA